MSASTPEDKLIRNLVIIAFTGVLSGILLFSTAVMVLVSANFNILNWME